MSATRQEQAQGAGKTFMSSDEVVERLGISKSTLYAYVSRGLIRSEPDPVSPRSRRYRADDVERLLNRQRMRSDPESTATSALDWGSPVMETDISEIVDEHLTYRGYDAVELARTRSFEEVIGLLWNEDFSSGLPQPSRRTVAVREQLLRQVEPLRQALDIPARVQMLLPGLEQHDSSSYDFRPENLQRIGANVIQAYIAGLAGADANAGIDRTLQAHWAPGEPDKARLIDAALILSADHQPNISTFTVRCVASAGAPLYSAIAAGIAALRGPKHGGATLQAAALVADIASPDQAQTRLRQRLERGEQMAGFGHRLYPSGDPRGAALIDLLREIVPESTELALAEAIISAALELRDSRPNFDFGLVMLCRALGQPGSTAFSLMALGRVAGWVAHAREAYERDRLIRPGSRFSGIDA